MTKCTKGGSGVSTLFEMEEFFSGWLEEAVKLAERDTILLEYLQFMTAADIEVDESLVRLLDESNNHHKAEIVPYPTNLVFFHSKEEQNSS